MNEKRTFKKANWISVISGVIVIGSGYILIFFVALSILFALLQKKPPFSIFTALTIILEGIMFFVTLSDMVYSTYLVFNYGFYLFVSGTVLLPFSYPIFNLIQQRTDKW